MSNNTTTRTHRRHVRRQVALAARYASLADMPRTLHAGAPAGDEAADMEHDQESEQYRAMAESALAHIAPADLAWARDEPQQSPAVQAAAAWAARQ